MFDDKQYLQFGLCKFNGGAGWYSWKRTDSDGNKIPDDQRMTYANIEVIKEGATIPSEADVNARIQKLKDAETVRINKKISAKAKLKELGLDNEELKTLGL